MRKFFRALRRAQRDIDLRPELYTHYYKNEFPVRYHAMMDTRRWGPGERLVFEPYTKEVYEETFKWIADHGIFADTGMGSGKYEEAVHQRSASAAAAMSRRDAAGSIRRAASAGCRRTSVLGEPTCRSGIHFVGAVRPPIRSRATPQPDQPVERRVIVEQFRASGARCTITPRSITTASSRQRQRDFGVLLDQDDGGALIRDHAAGSRRSAPRR